MALQAGIQKQLNANTLYNVEPLNNGAGQLFARLEVTGGSVNVWGADVLPVSPPTGMSKSTIGTAFSGIEVLGTVPNYLYVEIVGGTPVIVLTGVKATTPAV